MRTKIHTDTSRNEHEQKISARTNKYTHVRCVSTYLICPFTSPALEMKNALISSSDSSSNTVVGSKSAAHTSIPDRSGISSCGNCAIHCSDTCYSSYLVLITSFHDNFIHAANSTVESHGLSKRNNSLFLLKSYHT